MIFYITRIIFGVFMEVNVENIEDCIRYLSTIFVRGIKSTFTYWQCRCSDCSVKIS